MTSSSFVFMTSWLNFFVVDMFISWLINCQTFTLISWKLQISISKFRVTSEAVSRFFYKKHFYKQRQAESGKKIKQMLSNTLRVNFSYLKMIHILHLRYYSKIIVHILKRKQKKYICKSEDENEK